MTDTYGPGPEVRSNTGASWIGELYFNFGYAGVVIGMLILGIWFRLLQEHFFGPDATIPALLMACAILEQTARTVGGSVSSPINGAIFTLVPVAFLHMVVQVLSSPGRRPMGADGYAHSSIPADR